MTFSHRLRRVADRASLQALRFAIVGAAVFAVGATATAATAYAAGYRVNMTPSMPVGLWRVSGDGQFARGDVVWVCPPNTSPIREAHRFGFIPSGFCPSGFAPLLKPVVAVEGDAVMFSAAGLTVNGGLVPNSAPTRTNARGQALPRLRFGSYTVRPGEVWLISSYNPASFDSRYFGPVSASLVDGRAHPIAVKERP